MRSDDRGIAGFFVDIPALLAIIIGISIFTLSVYNAQLSYIERRNDDLMVDKLDDFMRNFRNYEFISESSGTFSAENIASLNLSILTSRYSPDSLGFHYKISIEDHSGYDEDHSTVFQTERLPKNKDVYSKTSSVLISCPMGRKHLAELQIQIWEVS